LGPSTAPGPPPKKSPRSRPRKRLRRPPRRRSESWSAPGWVRHPPGRRAAGGRGWAAPCWAWASAPSPRKACGGSASDRPPAARRRRGGGGGGGPPPKRGRGPTPAAPVTGPQVATNAVQDRTDLLRRGDLEQAKKAGIEQAQENNPQELALRGEFRWLTFLQ